MEPQLVCHSSLNDFTPDNENGFIPLRSHEELQKTLEARLGLGAADILAKPVVRRERNELAWELPFGGARPFGALGPGELGGALARLSFEAHRLFRLGKELEGSEWMSERPLGTSLAKTAWRIAAFAAGADTPVRVFFSGGAVSAAGWGVTPRAPAADPTPPQRQRIFEILTGAAGQPPGGAPPGPAPPPPAAQSGVFPGGSFRVAAAALLTLILFAGLFYFFFLRAPAPPERLETASDLEGCWVKSAKAEAGGTVLRRGFCFAKNGEINTTAEMIDSQGKVTDSCPTNSRAVMRGDNRFLITDRRRVRACSDNWRNTDLECELSSPGHFKCSFIDGNRRRDDPLDYVFTR